MDTLVKLTSQTPVCYGIPITTLMSIILSESELPKTGIFLLMKYPYSKGADFFV